MSSLSSSNSNSVNRYAVLLNTALTTAEDLRYKFNLPQDDRLNTLFENLQTRLQELHDEHVKPRSLLSRIFIRRPSLKEKLLFSLRSGLEIALDSLKTDTDENKDKKTAILRALNYPEKNVSLSDRIFNPIKYGLRKHIDIAVEKVVTRTFKDCGKYNSKIILFEKINFRISELKNSAYPIYGFLNSFASFLMDQKMLTEDKQNAIFLLLGQTSDKLKLGKNNKDLSLHTAREWFQTLDRNQIIERLVFAIGGDARIENGDKVSYLKQSMFPLFYQFLNTKSDNPQIEEFRKYLLNLHDSLIIKPYIT